MQWGSKIHKTCDHFSIIPFINQFWFKKINHKKSAINLLISLIQKFAEHLSQTIKYPVRAVETGIEGRVFVEFTVDTAGRVTDAKVIRGVDPVLDEEALRVIQSAPNWEPDKQRGIPVNVSFVIPVEFSLDGDQ